MKNSLSYEWNGEMFWFPSSFQQKILSIVIAKNSKL